VEEVEEEEEGVEHLEESEGGAGWMGVVDWLWKSHEEREEPRIGKWRCSFKRGVMYVERDRE
jgi:hypothetical protein